jgi:signal transduction histidine kinase
VRAAVTRIGRDAQRAADIVGRIRSQFEKATPNREILDVNEIIRETAALLRSEAVRYNISVRTELTADLPQIIGDRVQLQQVTMNLILNSFEAMKDVEGVRELTIKSQRSENEQLLVTVSDTGTGFHRNWQNRYSTRSLQPNPTAPAWGFALAGQSLSLMVGVCGRRVPLGAAQPFI